MADYPSRSHDYHRLVARSDEEAEVKASSLLARLSRRYGCRLKYWVIIGVFGVAILVILANYLKLTRSDAYTTAASPAAAATAALSSFLSKPAQYDYPFLDPRLSWDDRVSDLLDELTIDEIVPQTQAIYGRPTPGVSRLGIKEYSWIAECIHGQKGTQGTTFPVPLALAASFSEELLYSVAEAIGKEVRAHYNQGRAEGKSSKGLTCFSPTINIMRHPSWGRNHETYGEDPYLTGKMAAAYVNGLQGNHSRYVRAAATCKHFAAHSGPEKDRYKFNSVVTVGDMWMTYLPPFKACISAGVMGVMCSYNKINGEPACVNRALLKADLRGIWRFRGFVVSDAKAIYNIMSEHKFHKNEIDVVNMAIKMGTNLELTTNNLRLYQKQSELVRDGVLTEKEVRDSARPLFYTRMRLGEFDPPAANPYNRLNMSVVQSEGHRRLAERAAMSSFVLLKNDRNTLPLKKTYNHVTVVGPMADSAKYVYSSWAPDIHPNYSSTAFQGLSRLAQHHTLVRGCSSASCSDYDPSSVISGVSQADLVVFTWATDHEGETIDRMDYAPAGKSLQMLQDVVKNVPSTVPIIVILLNGVPFDISWAKHSDRIGAILECFLPGQATGDAIYKVLTNSGGRHSVPAGRLPFTWPKTLLQARNITDYSMAGRTYRYMEEEPLYPFGYGLSYTTFSYSELSINTDLLPAGDNFYIYVTLTNLGPYDAEEVVQVYLQWTHMHSLSLPQLQLVRFKRVFLAALTIQKLSFMLTRFDMMVWLDKEQGYQVPKVPMKVFVGGQQPGSATRNRSNVLEATFTIV